MTVTKIEQIDKEDIPIIIYFHKKPFSKHPDRSRAQALLGLASKYDPNATKYAFDIIGVLYNIIISGLSEEELLEYLL